MRIFKGALLLLLCTLALTARAQLQFPELTGRVVDNELIEAPVIATLNQELQAHEKATGEQIVVVTLPDLQGTSIEDYGYQLGRHWGQGAYRSGLWPGGSSDRRPGLADHQPLDRAAVQAWQCFKRHSCRG